MQNTLMSINTQLLKKEIYSCFTFDSKREKYKIQNFFPSFIKLVLIFPMTTNNLHQSFETQVICLSE